MKKAVIQCGAKQYLVSEGDDIEVDLIKSDKKTLDFDTLLLIDDKKTQIGLPILDSIKVTAEITEADVASEKVTSIRYKAKKRVKKVRGHRQHHTLLKVKKIA